MKYLALNRQRMRIFRNARKANATMLGVSFLIYLYKCSTNQLNELIFLIHRAARVSHGTNSFWPRERHEIVIGRTFLPRERYALVTGRTLVAVKSSSSVFCLYQKMNHLSGRTNSLSSSSKVNLLFSWSGPLICPFSVFIRTRINRCAEKYPAVKLVQTNDPL